MSCTNARRTAAEHGFRAGEVYALTGLGQNARRAGRLTEACEHLLEAAAWYRRTGGSPGCATVLIELGYVAESRGDAATAAAHHEEALDAARRVGDPHSQAAALVGLAGARLLAGSAAAAVAELLGAADRLRGGDPVPPADSGDLERIIAAAQLTGRVPAAGDPRSSRTPPGLRAHRRTCARSPCGVCELQDPAPGDS